MSTTKLYGVTALSGIFLETNIHQNPARLLCLTGSIPIHQLIDVVAAAGSDAASDAMLKRLEIAERGV